MCTVTKFLVEHSPSDLSTQGSTPFKTIDKERMAWQARASCLVTEHTPVVCFGIKFLTQFFISQNDELHYLSAFVLFKLRTQPINIYPTFELLLKLT